MPSSTAQPESKMVPNYEVKLLMDPKIVLDSNNKLQAAVLGIFKVAPVITKMSVQFLDTNDKVIYNSGWSPRIRNKQGQADIELSYKRRYKIANGDIDGALTTASKDGFNSTSSIYKAQVDWGFKNQTLSINHDFSFSDNGNNAKELPGEEQSRSILVKQAPENFDDFGEDKLGTENLTNKLKESRIYGPVFVDRYTGIWNDEDVDIEVCPIRDADRTGIEYIVEVSFKTKKRSKALEEHDELATLLRGEGWLLERDSLKTSLIMERY